MSTTLCCPVCDTRWKIVDGLVDRGEVAVKCPVCEAHAEYCRVLGHDPARTLLLPVARELVEQGWMTGPVLVEMSDRGRGVADCVFTRVSQPAPRTAG